MDAITQFKEGQKQVWSGFAAMESLTGTVAPTLVRYAGVSPGSKVLDVGCGTGVVALTAARHGAVVTGVDLTPPLIERARENAALMGLSAEWHVGDVEDLPFPEAEFDIVLSQFGHMFAPRPEVAVAEMLRVLRPGGTIAFSTWPPEHVIGSLFRLVGRYLPPPEGVAPPPLWGDRRVVQERLGEMVDSLEFDVGVMIVYTLSPRHNRLLLESDVGPVKRTVQTLESEPERLATFRAELEELIGQYFEDNQMRQEFLMTRAVKK